MAEKSFSYGHFCQNCRKPLDLDDQVYFVEDKSGNYFCSEPCIQEFYGPMARFYYQEHVRLRDPHDIPADDFKSYEEYSILTVDTPDELWVEENDTGEEFYFYIKEFSDAGGKFYYIIMTYCLETDPTFVLLSAPTRDKRLLEHYRRGKRVKRGSSEMEAQLPVNHQTQQSTTPQHESLMDERAMALKEEMLRNRRKGDIRPHEFEEHSYLLDETIENPDEAWEMEAGEEGDDSILTLITQHDERLHYIVICGLDDNSDPTSPAWRVLYHFPTGDAGLVQRYRRGLPREGAAPENHTGAGTNAIH